MTYDRPKWRSVLFLHWAKACRDTMWEPGADIYRTCNNGWIIKFDLAGVQPEDIAISTQGSYLIVSGVRRDWIFEEGWSCHSMEISYSRFERRINLPCDLARARIATEYRHGMLLVRVSMEENGL